MTAGRRLLALDGAVRSLAVSLDGAALRVEAADTPQRLAPLRQIDRVLCRGAVAWTAEALMAAAEAGAPVAFVRGDGRIAALLTQPPPRHAPLSPAFRARAQDVARRLERVSQLRGWPDAFADFWRAELSRALRALGDEQPARAIAEGWQAWERNVARMARPIGHGPRLARDLRAFIELWTRRRLAELGAPGAWLGVTPADRADLVQPFALTLAWTGAPLVAGAIRRASRRAARPDAALESSFGATLTLAELSAPRLERRLRPVFTRFYRRLVDLETEALFAEGLTWDG